MTFGEKLNLSQSALKKRSNSVILDSEKVCKSEVAMKKKSDKLSCYEVQHSIKEYLLDEMKPEEAYAFVKHVRSCSICREEVEEYYAFSSALMHLDALNEEEDKGNFFVNIEKRLERTEQMEAKSRKDHRIRRIVYLLVALCIAAAMGVSIGV